MSIRDNAWLAGVCDAILLKNNSEAMLASADEELLNEIAKVAPPSEKYHRALFWRNDKFAELLTRIKPYCKENH